MYSGLPSISIDDQSETDGKTVWSIQHPALNAPVKFDPRDPGKIGPEALTVYERGLDLTEAKIANDLISFLIGRRKVPQDTAESLMDAWEFHIRGERPWFTVPSLIDV